MKNVLADGRLTQRVRQGRNKPPTKYWCNLCTLNILAANAQCPIRLPFKLFSILSYIILWVQLRLWERNCRGLKRVARQQEKGQAGGAWGLAQSSHVNVTRQTAPWFKGTVSLDFQISYIFLVFLYHSTPYDLLIHRQKLFCKLLLIWKDTVVPVYSTI